MKDKRLIIVDEKFDDLISRFIVKAITGICYFKLFFVEKFLQKDN